jgi:hypothetical protein
MPMQKTVGGIQCRCLSFLKFGIVSLTIQYNTHKSFTARLEKIKRWRRNEGLPFKKALFATAHKLIRVIFAMLTKRTHYVSGEMITG